TRHFPKVLIFAVNDLPHTSHADQLVKICREVFNQGDDFVQKITGSPTVDRPLQKIREFRNRPTPKVVVSVDMLTTGVDIPSLEFIVFLRPVKSRILWVQMLGRGTRLCPEINKDKFTIFDCFDGTLIEYFQNATDFVIEPPQKEPISIAQVIENIYQNVDRQYYTKALIKRLRRIEKNMSGDAREMFSAYIPEGDIGKLAGDMQKLLNDDFAGTMAILRDKDFQELLVNYPRAKRSFVIGYGVQDDVTSEKVIHIGDEYLKPEDYLVSFARFVQENPEHIEAIRILLERPKEWKTDALEDLRQKLMRNKYPEKQLQKAHKLVYNKALADIISMVKHAAKDDAPIWTAEERVDHALETFKAGKTFNDEQTLWLGYIRQHLIENLTIELDDFEYAPVFERHGGKGKASRVFEGKLEQLVKELNYSIAA
ncbi:type I restriction-modification enzyme R subunit C-terminal domain-containing protein, partial [Nitrospirota bacterium]